LLIDELLFAETTKVVQPLIANTRARHRPLYHPVTAGPRFHQKPQLAAYMKICALLVPKEMKAEHSGGLSALTDEELDAALDALRALLAERAGGGDERD
jgi:hypothetical protein